MDEQNAGRKWLAPMGALAVLLAVVTGCQPSDEDVAQEVAASPSTASTYSAPAPASASSGSGLARSRWTKVAQVIDGDTFELAGGERVRVLGIDSCEMSTDRGSDAKFSAQGLLGGGVVLTQEPGVDRDRYGRLLRYVEVPSGDFAKSMVGSDHTGVYEGRNDASPARLAELRAADSDGRTCDEPEPYVAPAPVVTDDDDDSRTYVPAPDVDKPKKKRTGNSGHPCGPSERDGDGDGYCGEGK